MNKKNIFLLSFLFILLCFIIVIYNNDYYLTGIDDANIYFVYMKNFASGFGFVYNKNGELVEGFTSLLWTLIGSFFYFIFNNSHYPLIVFNIIILSITTYRMLIYLSDILARKIYLYLFLLSFFFLPNYFDWTLLSLLETGLWSSIIINLALYLLNYIRDSNNSFEFNILLFFLVFIRPEALFFGMIFLFLKIFTDIENGKFLSLLKYNFTSILLFVLANIILFVWRYYYFGFLFPNTYYAKISHNFLSNFSAGYIYIKSYFVQNFFAFLIFIIGLYSIAKNLILNKSIKKYLDIFIIISILSLAYIFPIYSGGDHFGGFRFYQPTAPLSIILFFIIYLKIKEFTWHSRLIFICIFLIQIFFGYNNNLKNFIYQTTPIKPEFEIAITGKERSEKLYDFFCNNNQLPSQGIIAAGGANFYKGISIDLVGLNNVEMAHSPKSTDEKEIKNHFSFNKEVFYRQKPDIIWICGDFLKYNDLRTPKVRAWEGNIIKNVHKELKFQKLYSLYQIQNIKNKKYILKAYLRNDFVKKLNANTYIYKKLD